MYQKINSSSIPYSILMMTSSFPVSTFLTTALANSFPVLFLLLSCIFAPKTDQQIKFHLKSLLHNRAATEQLQTVQLHLIDHKFMMLRIETLLN